MFRFGPFSLALVLALAPWASADGPPKAPAAPHSRLEPRPGPGAGQAFLRKFEGEWSVHKSFFPKSGGPIRSEGACRQTMVHGGRFLRSDFQFGAGPNPTIGQGLIGFDTQTGRFTSVWSDSRSNRFSFRQSRGPFDGKQIVLFSQTLDPDAGPREIRRTRTVTRLEDDGKRILHQQFAPGADGGERLMMELRMERRTAGRPAKPEN